MDDISAVIFGVALLIYGFWLTILISRFRSRNAKRKAILRSELRKTRVLITVASLLFPLITSGLIWMVSLIFGQRLLASGDFLLFVMVCPVGLWLFSMSVLWSYTAGWRTIDSEEDE